MKALPGICSVLVLCSLAAEGAGEGGIRVHVLNPSGVEGVAGAVVLVNPGQTYRSFAVVADNDGNAYLPKLDCKICTMTAADPRGLFLPRTTEFDGGQSSVTTMLMVKPVIDRVRRRDSTRYTLLVLRPDGEPLKGHQVVIRPDLLTLTNNWLAQQTMTSRDGMVEATLAPGEYTMAALIDTHAYYYRFSVGSRRVQKLTLYLGRPEANLSAH